MRLSTRIGLTITAVLAGATWHTHAQEAQTPRQAENKAQRLTRSDSPTRDLSDPEQRALYAVAYAHLDTQWRWDFPTTIDEYIHATLVDNFALLEKYPDYVFNFTGSVRYEMMREYYPELYEQLKDYIAQGRWFVSGSSVDEGDVNVPSSESIIRQVLYGNLYFEREFGKVSTDFMLPDCFGFPASLPSLWAHCGLLGFSTQKLTWGSAVGIPFEVGVWRGPDGNGIIAALDPGPYVGAIEGRVDTNAQWNERVARNGEEFGLWADYHYYGTGDQGGAPREDAVANYTQSARATDGDMDLVLGSSSLLYEDITDEQRLRLPRFEGDMLLTEHSAGTLTSQSYMKRWNRMGEQLGDAAERSATMAWALAGDEYPREKLERSWVRVLANQMHDILPGTSIPRAYRYSWNDEIVAMNGFADVMTRGAGAISSRLDTQTEGTPLVVFNPLAIGRRDIVEATIPMGNGGYPRVFDDEGGEVPSQVIRRDDDGVTFVFLADVDPNSMTVFEVRDSESPFDDGGGPSVRDRSIENERYLVELDDRGDVVRVFDKLHEREILERPAQLVFTHEKPRQWPAWNMDWADRIKDPLGTVDGAPTYRIAERGPVRARLEVTRWARNSRVTQSIVLTRSGNVVEFDNEIDWQSAEVALRASLPLTVANSNATYNWGSGTIERGNIEPKRYEVPSHEWFDLTDSSGGYGVTIVEDSKFGSDKPTDNEVRLTLLYSPGVRSGYLDQHSQDWGLHEIRYGVAGHGGDWREGRSEWIGRRFNQPLRSFVVPRHDGSLGRSYSLASVSTEQVDIRAIKLAEREDVIIVRLQELWGKDVSDVRLRLGLPIRSAREVDGQERSIGDVRTELDEIVVDMTSYGLKTIAIEVERDQGQEQSSTSVRLAYDTDAASTDSDPRDGGMDAQGLSYPAEMLPSRLRDHGVEFVLGGAGPGEKQAVTARGQTIELPEGEWDMLHLLVAADEDLETIFRLGDREHRRRVQSWTGFIGQWNDRVWDREFGKVDFKGEGNVTAILPGFIKREPIAWFATHHHHPERGNEAYKFSYLYRLSLPRHGDASSLVLPYDERVKLFAASVSEEEFKRADSGAPLYDTLEHHDVIQLRHNYNAVVRRVFSDIDAAGVVETDRERRFELLSIGTPQDDDDISGGYSFVNIDSDGSRVVRPNLDGDGDALRRLNDGAIGQNSDDTQRSVWYDSEGRFALDLRGSREIESISMYSWHRSNRSPQLVSVWGSNREAMPDASFRHGGEGEWELLGMVDTRELGDGDIHGSRIAGRDGASLGPYRYLLWIAEDTGQGTFFQEIDIEFGSE